MATHPKTAVKEEPTAAAQQVPAEDRKVEQMNPTRMTEAEFLRSIYVCTAVPYPTLTLPTKRKL